MKRNITVTPLSGVTLFGRNHQWIRSMNYVGQFRAFDVSTERDVGTISDMAESMASPQARADYWNAVHDGADEKTRSWYQNQPVMTFRLLDELGVRSNASVIDVGGGASNLVDQLLAKHFTDITVLDVSSEAIEAARQRVGTDPHVTWLVGDLLTWTSDRRYDVWHDRAVFHFMSGEQIDVLSLIHISEPTRQAEISYAVFCLKKQN